MAAKQSRKPQTHPVPSLPTPLEVFTLLAPTRIESIESLLTARSFWLPELEHTVLVETGPGQHTRNSPVHGASSWMPPTMRTLQMWVIIACAKLPLKVRSHRWHNSKGCQA